MAKCVELHEINFKTYFALIREAAKMYVGTQTNKPLQAFMSSVFFCGPHPHLPAVYNKIVISKPCL